MTTDAGIAPVPFPRDGHARLEPPDPAEVRVIASGFATAPAPASGLTEVQRAVLNALIESMTGESVDVATVDPLGPAEFADALRDRNREFRTRMVQTMLLAEMLLVPLPPEVSARVETYAAWLGVDDEMMGVVRRVAHGSLGLALIDFKRSGYFEHMLRTPPETLHVSSALQDAWQLRCDDPALYERWKALGDCPAGSLGLGVWRFYRARGFTFPGRPESAPPNLAQHDWVHVLADFGSTVASEIEAFGFIARANDDPRAFSLLAMVLGLFETGYLHDAANLFEYDRGHLSRDAPHMATRLADAMYRGAKVGWYLDDNGRSDETDLMALDWFVYADWAVDDVRADLGVLPKSPKSVAAGSTTPWGPGGISPYQLEHGRAAAENEGYAYDSYGATPG
jgi:hypothetical protein